MYLTKTNIQQELIRITLTLQRKILYRISRKHNWNFKIMEVILNVFFSIVYIKIFLQSLINIKRLTYVFMTSLDVFDLTTHAQKIMAETGFKHIISWFLRMNIHIYLLKVSKQFIYWRAKGPEGNKLFGHLKQINCIFMSKNYDIRFIIKAINKYILNTEFWSGSRSLHHVALFT